MTLTPRTLSLTTTTPHFPPLEDPAFLLLSSSLPAPGPPPFLKSETHLSVPASPIPGLAFPAPSHRHNLSTSSAPPMLRDEDVKQERTA